MRDPVAMTAVRTRTSVRALLGSMLAGSLCWASSAGAQHAPVPDAARLDPILVTAKRRYDPAADERMKAQVEEALHTDPFFYDDHVTVTIENGIATLRGMVFDDWDMRQAIRISRRIAGVKRVINDLEMVSGGD
jgi:BON domain